MALRLRLIQGLMAPSAEGFARIGNHQIEIDVDDPAETSASFAGSEWAIKGKNIRRRIAVRNIAVRAMQMIAERLAGATLAR